MDLSYLKKLIKLVESSGIGELELEEEGSKIRIAKAAQNTTPAHSYQPLTVSAPAVPTAPNQVPQAATAPQTSQAEPPQPKANIHEVKSPIVGTFYRAPAPDAEPYVEMGQNVQTGAVLCIVEAMKLMNEIESDIAGRIVKICVDNGQPVEYNQTLFHIEKV